MTSGGKKILVGVMSGILVLGAAYCGLGLYFQNHFFPGTVINGVNASWKTSQAVEEAIKKEINGYSMTLVERNHHKEKIYGSDVELKPVFHHEVKSALEQQNGFAFLTHFWKKDQKELPRTISYKKEYLNNVIAQLDCMDAEQTELPQDAHLSSYDKGYNIVAEKEGNTLKEDVFLKLIDDALMNLRETVDLDKAGCYEEPVYTAETPQLKKALDLMNQYTSAVVHYDFGVTLDGSEISSFLKMNKKFQVSINKEAVAAYVRTQASRYNSIFSTRTFHTSYGKDVTVKGGDYGWWMNEAAEVNQLLKDIEAGKETTREAVYLQKAASHEKGNDYGNTYVEVNLSAQHMFFYKEGKLMLEADVVTGNTTLKNGTPQGTYGVTYKESDATLVGENYATPVKYWMPFNGNIGLHDADWRDEFGGQLYLKEGSHGCVNMPPKKAKKLFSLISKGDPVIVYELAGTESNVTRRP